MRRLLLLAASLTCALLVGRQADAAFVTGCCACVPNVAHTASQVGPPVEEALFCRLVTGTGFPEFVQACQDAGGGAQPCFPETPGVACTTTLAAENIICPTGPGAPTATPWGLGALALALSLLGIWTRRSVR